MSSAVVPAQRAESDLALRHQLANMRGLLILSMLMTESCDEEQILRLAASSVPSVARCRAEGAYLIEGTWKAVQAALSDPVAREAVTTQLAALGRNGGPVRLPGRAWSWALPLGSVGSFVGYLLVSADEKVDIPTEDEKFVLHALAQQTASALVNARTHAKERATAAELRAANESLGATVQALKRTTRIHERFTQVSLADEGRDGIAAALHELTGYPVAIEDRYGNLQSWAGPHRPTPYPKDPPARREQLLRRALREGRPIRDGGRMLAVASPRPDVIGVVALIDPSATAGDQELLALEYAGTVLAMELVRLRSLAETELRLRRDLVEELLAGTDEESALARASALSYDLERPHWVLVLEGRGRTQDADMFFHAVRRAMRASAVGSMLVTRGDTVVVLADREVDWEAFRETVLTELGGGRCRIGIGGRCDRPSEFPRSYREATIALKIQRSARGPDQAVSYDDLGVYQLLGEVEDPAVVERLVRRWLGALIDYDAKRHSELVETLSQYLECGGAYDRAATALCVHRSTLKYRLQRIREISGLDLTDPDTQFNLQLATRAWRTLRALRS
ncbi:helix-turn-helix domain-containing protein [Thermocrispum sp.]|uniref:Helix-turn-helix domain-containing protein n=3 Tax=Thermocrispum agreste TaxID=37925 RepID=A0ABD6FEA0_9PSEU|nr:helix-turn-helix domain-containing protein [Thermocrispum sp.]